MLWFERQVVTALVTTSDDRRRSAVEDYVDGALKAMPEYVRAGVAAESMALGGWAAVNQRLGRLDRAHIERWLDAWADSPIGPLRQWVRLLRSLVLFAELELVTQ